MVWSSSALYPYYNLAEASIVDFRYITPLVLKRTVEALKARSGEDGDYIVAQPYSVEFRVEGRNEWNTVTVPAGLITDLASVPRIARSVIDRVGPHLEAAIVHDYLYVAWQDIPGRDARDQDRYFADQLFLAGMVAAGVSWTKRNLIYRAVRTFGSPVYRGLNSARYAQV
jgi:hypothetical protein